MSIPPECPELAAVDADLRESFLADYEGRYVPKLPILIQLVRLLRRLLHEGDDGEHGAGHGECSMDSIRLLTKTALARALQILDERLNVARQPQEVAA